MELLTNHWFLIFTGINIIALMILIKKFQFKGEKTPSLYEILREAGIFPTIRKPVNPDDLKENEKNNQKDKNP